MSTRDKHQIAYFAEPWNVTYLGCAARTTVDNAFHLVMAGAEDGCFHDLFGWESHLNESVVF
jgi:hypothetical protein